MPGEKLINKQIAIYFNDGRDVTRKDGICIEVLDHAVVFKDPMTDLVQLVPFYKIIRIIEKP